MRTTNRSIGAWVLPMFLVIAGFFLVTEHRAHFFGALPFLLLAACLLLHSFSHGRHGAHGRGKGGHTHETSGGTS
jgi:hypothetical protein